MTLGLFLTTCDDPNFSNPLSNNMGEKVVVEPPVIYDISPVSGSYLSGIVNFTAKAKAYIRVVKVEVYVYKDEENGQREIPWTDAGISLSGDIKLKTMRYDFDTTKYNSGKDGPIRMKFRIFDTTNKPVESIQLIYIIKNNPSVIKMAYPSDADVISLSYAADAEITGSTELPKIPFAGDIRGQIIDRRGLRPGYPQIKLWPHNDENGNVMPEPADDDLQWGYASLFLSYCGDDMEKETAATRAGPGKYTDRSTVRVVNSSSFSLRLAEYTIVPDPNNPDVRKVQYKVGTLADSNGSYDGKHIPFQAGRIFNFKIRTRDVEPDPTNGAKPSADPVPLDPEKLPWIEGFYPPKDMGTPNENSFEYRGNPVKIRIWSSGAVPAVELNNDDIEGDELISTPNKYITETDSYKIITNGFRLRIFLTLDGGEISDMLDKATLEYKHDKTGESGTLAWDSATGTKGDSYVKNGNPDPVPGLIFTYTSNSSIFNKNGLYYLVFKVYIQGEMEPQEYTYNVTLDGNPPNVDLRYIQGAASDPTGAAAVIPGGKVIASPYTVNGNIQVVVIDPTDNESGIMVFRSNANMGELPYNNLAGPFNEYNVDNGRPMVKWILEKAAAGNDPPADTGDTVRARLKTYMDAPTSGNLSFFKDIQDTRTSSLNQLPSGWVRRELPDNEAKIDADKNAHFKINTLPLLDKDYYWLYVIAMDQVQNLGFIAQKIYIDQETDNPKPVIDRLSDTNAGGTTIADEKGLDVKVTITNVSNVVERKMTGNWSGSATDGKRNNILGLYEGIGLRFTDDDGITLEKGGVTIILTDLNTPKAPNSPVTFSSATPDGLTLLRSVLNSGDDRDMSGTLSQEIMAKALYGAASEGKLKDGMYKLQITVKDDIDKKVKITPAAIPGDNPTEASRNDVYYFAVSTELPVITVTQPENNALGSKNPIDIYGTVKSRFTMQNAWITFTPNVITPDGNKDTSGPLNLPLYTDANYQTIVTELTPAPTPDANGYYTYYWIRKAVIFHPQKPNNGGDWFASDAYSVRSFTVEMYDRIGNVNKEERAVRVDDSAPTLTLSDFNYSRPRDKAPLEDKLYVYGKVSFTVSASDSDGLYEVDDVKNTNTKMSGIKWWVLPKGDPEPSWSDLPKDYENLALTPNKWKGGGYFSADQARSGGNYIGVIDTRYLTENTAEYRLYYMAMDKAGNTAMKYELKPSQPPPATESFWVDQSRDSPYIYENSLSPKPNDVVGTTTLAISGTVGDADRFNPAAANNYLTKTYVEIRFPNIPNSVNSDGTINWSQWIPIKIPAKYSLDGGISPSEDIDYKFKLEDYESAYPAAKTYLTGDGIKYYQIRVTDEADGPVGTEKGWYGKNPDYFMTIAPDNANYPGYNSVYLRHDKISKIFPTDTTGYIFFRDTSKPVIYFNEYDPDKTHENYRADRPTYSKWEQLKAVFSNAPTIYNGGNYVKEYKLADLTMSWSAGTKSFEKTLINNPPGFKVGDTAGEYPWDSTTPVSAVTEGEDKGKLKWNVFTTTDDNKLKAVFDDAPQGPQIVLFEATDTIPNTGRATWMFYKDTQGPSIIFSNISRSIERDYMNPDFPASPAWPSDWASDWPTGRHDTTTAAWKTAWTQAWRNIIEYWPSEYAFKTATEIQSALKAENERLPSTVIGDDNTPAVIRGTFEDEFSSLVTPSSTTHFYYRFRDKKGTLQAVQESGLVGVTRVLKDGEEWIEKALPTSTEPKRSADWEIILNAANGFTGSDGLNLLDIRIADTPAENISEIFKVRFLLDRAPPLLGNYGTPYPADPNTIIKEGESRFRISKLGNTAQAHPALVLPEAERVISAAGSENGTGIVFSVSGRVNDYNLSYLRINLGQDGTTAYTFEASVDIDSSSTSVTDVTSSDTEKRLTVTGPYKAGTLNSAYTADDTGTPEWEWTFNILEKDAFELRKAATAIGATDSNRRFIRVTASDKAGKREGPVEWAFYLDTKKPVIEYTNLEKGRSGSSFESDVKLSGLVSDDTKIKDVLYIIGRWDYTDKAWRWYNGTEWNINTLPSATDLTKWTSAFTDATTPARQTTMDWTIDQAKLNAAGTGKYPANLFNTEGQYRIDLYVTDFSYGDGNPHNTVDGNNDETTYDPSDGAIISDNGFRDTGYNATAGTGSASARVFYIDKKDPTLRWASTIEEKTYFRNEDSGDDKGKAIFGFIAGDGNTLQKWTVEVRDKAGKIVEYTSIEWNAGTGKTTLAIDEPKTVASDLTLTPTNPATVANKLISDTSIYEQYFEVKPYMTSNAEAGGTPLDKLANNSLPTYTITITVTDGAKRTSSISKQFTLDNTPPEFIKEKYNPLSYKYGSADKPADPDTISTNPKVERSYTYDAVTGKLTIRGNTTDNSNQIKSISYYVVSDTDSTSSGVAWSKFPTPAEVETAKKWRSVSGTGDNASEIKTGATTLIQLDEGTLFAWSVMAPQTSLFLSDTAVGQKYVQSTNPGGKSIKGDDKTAGEYYDVDTGTPTVPATWATTKRTVPTLTFPDLNNLLNTTNPKAIYGGDPVGLITVYVRAEDAAGNVAYDALKYWIWPEGDRPIVTAINNPDSSKIEIERLLNGTIRLSGMAKDNERVKYVWFRVLDPNGVPYGTGTLASKPLHIPVWQDTKIENGKIVPIGGNWEEATPKAEQKSPDFPVDGLTIGSRRTDDTITDPTGGWYMANGGNSKEVSWYAYVNTNGELDPTGTEESKKFTVEVRAQDVTYDEKNDKWMDYVTNGYRGMASAMTTVSRVDAWVVAGAPIFEKAFVAPVDSKTAEAAESTPNKIWESIDTLNMRNRSSYKVTVKHNSGLSSIRWSPTFWDKSLSSGGITGAFQANPKLDQVNLLDLADTNSADPDCVYVYRTGTEAYKTDATKKRDAVFADMAASGNANSIPRMALTVKPQNMKGPGSVTLNPARKYMVWKWDEALENGAFPHTSDASGKCNDPTHWAIVEGVSKHKDMKNSVFTPTTAGPFSIGTAILIESEPEASVNYFKWTVFVDVRADLLLADMIADDNAYGNGTTARAGQVKNSVRYPVYLSASEVSKATPLTSRGDTLLPIDNLEPYGMYTLNRKPAGTAVTIGGEAGDDGPVNGIARVVLWFQRAGTNGKFISWHETHPEPETTLTAVTDFQEYIANSGPVWWDAVTVATTAPGVTPSNGVIPSGVKKPKIPAKAATTGGDYAIVIDDNNPSKGATKWGQTLPMGFADGGLGKLWYVEINSYGIESGPVDMHYVVIDKAGNAKYYKERLVIMNGVAVIDRVKLATDIRHTSWNGTNLAGNKGEAGGKKYDDKANPPWTGSWPILQDIRNKVPLGGPANEDPQNDVKKGISDWVSASALGAGKVIDFNVRNNLFALRVETTKGPLSTKSRNFRLEYVSGARLMSDSGGTGQKLTDIKAGRIYIINNPGTARWGTFGAEGDESTWKKRGYAFIATVNGSDLDALAQSNIGAGSAWELNNGYPAIGERTSITPAALQLGDVKYAAGNANAESAEFVYANAAFPSIVDCNGPTDVAFPPTPNATYTDWTTWTNANWSLFILRVFDGVEEDIFGDFTILRVRVNNDDKSLPFAQLYDFNPKTEGQDRSTIAADTATEERRSISPMFVGEGTGSNRTKGGLWNSSPTLGALDKPGHIEPRKITYTTAPYSTQQHSLSSAQMGGAATSVEASITKPFADPAGFFTTDTVSGRVVLRGYAEDDQRVQSVSLVIGGETINILNYPTNGTTDGNAADSATYTSPKTGMLSIPTAQAGKVYYTDSIDLYRHRVEWAYIWDTETIPASTVVGNNISVRVVSYPRNGANGTTPKTTGSDTIAAPGTAHVATPNPNNALEATRPNTSPYNKDFPVNMYKYNSINVNLRPYITGFLRNTAEFSHNTRSRQGRYMFYRGETAVVKGFNLGGAGNTTPTISINGASTNTSNVGTIANYGITTANNSRYRQFTVGSGVTTGNSTTGNYGVVTYSFNQPAVNTGSERTRASGTPVRPAYIQPWNIEYSPGVDGSTLWEDFTQAHIWQSNDVYNTGADRGRFPRDADMEIFDPAMSINHKTGDLWESHNEGGGNGNNTGSTKVSNNNGVGSFAVAAFIDPITNSDIYISERDSGYNSNNNAYTVWSVYSIIGKPGGGNIWRYFGGVWISGPSGGNPSVNHQSGFNVSGGTNSGFANGPDVAARSQYHGESTFYNAYPDGTNLTQPGGPALNQFKNPHIISYWDNSNEHIHVSYYDTKDKSMKYRYNRRQQAQKIDGNTTANAGSNGLTDIPRGWTNLDGGQDAEDQNAASNATTFFNVATGNSTRINNNTPRSTDAGEYNSIAVTSQGYPVIAYYDKAGQKLKLAISNSATPIAGNAWTIVQNVITDTPAGRQTAFTGTGEYVSMRIDTRVTPNVVHIAAMNSSNKTLVYIKGTISATGTYACTDVQVVDSVGSVGRWCALSLDNDGNPWISYQDESYQGSRDGIKLAYYNTGTYYKGGANYFSGKDVDMNNVAITGWEAMHVPTAFRVENARQGMECYPTRNFTETRTVANKDWTGAVGYLGQDYYRAAYYMK